MDDEAGWLQAHVAGAGGIPCRAGGDRDCARAVQRLCKDGRHRAAAGVDRNREARASDDGWIGGVERSSGPGELLVTVTVMFVGGGGAIVRMIRSCRSLPTDRAGTRIDERTSAALKMVESSMSSEPLRSMSAHEQLPVGCPASMQ